MRSLNKSDEPNPAIAARFHAVHRWRGVGDPHCEATLHTHLVYEHT